jgi:uncharacterized protein (TIGR03437 family)
MSKIPVGLSVLFLAKVLSAQPTIFPHKVVSAASFMDPGLAGGAIARGSVFAIIGSGLGPAQPVQVSSYPLGTTLAGVSVRLTQGTTPIDAIPIAVSAGQVNAIMPSGAALGTYSITVTYNGQRSNPGRVKVVNASPGIYTANSGGFGPAILQNINADGSQPINSLAQPATPGQTMTLWLTGLGPATAPDNQPPVQGNLPTPVEVYVAGIQAQVSYSGRSPYNGTDQINFNVPATAPYGCWVPVYVRTEAVTVSNVVTMAISADGSPCTDTGHALAQAFAKGGKIGLITLTRSAIHEDVGTARVYDVITDVVNLNLISEKPTPFNYSQNFSLPPAGSCTVYTVPGDLFAGDPFYGADPNDRYLSTGYPVTVAGARGTKSVAKPVSAKSYGQLGFSISGAPINDTTLLAPGDFTVISSVGPDVGAMNTKITVPPPLTWTNRDQLSTVTRSQGVTVNWSGVPAGQVVFITGGAVDVPNNVTGMFYCVASAGASSFTVPPAILANVPASRPVFVQTKALIYVGMAPGISAPTFTAAGLDTAVAMPVYLSGKTVTFK